MKQSEIIDFLKDLVIILAIVFFIRTFVGMPFQISGQSMASSYYNKEFILVDRLSYFFGGPDRWDVVVFTPWVDKDKKYFLKRIIGIPGDSIKIESGIIFVKKADSEIFIQLNETYLNLENNWFTFSENKSVSREYRLGEDQFFVMGDNRNHSTDSRHCFYTCSIEGSSNFASSGNITGKVFLDLGYFSLRNFSFIDSELGLNTTPKFFSSEATHTYTELN